jgi:hypothetical protein
MSGSVDYHIPPQYWVQLSPDDKSEFVQLRNSFHHGQQVGSRDSRAGTFHREVATVISFTERNAANVEARAVLTGLACAGQIICINTRQLKYFLSRCKSSINASFQQLGFVAMRSKAKARLCVTAALPSLRSQAAILRQWTVRYTSDDAPFCFVSLFRFARLPEILPADLCPEKGARMAVPAVRPPPQALPGAPVKPTVLPFELASVDPFAPEQHREGGAMTSSVSVGSFQEVESKARGSMLFPFTKTNMKRSESHQFGLGSEWNLFDEDSSYFY